MKDGRGGVQTRKPHEDIAERAMDLGKRCAEAPGAKERTKGAEAIYRDRMAAKPCAEHRRRRDREQQRLERPMGYLRRDIHPERHRRRRWNTVEKPPRQAYDQQHKNGETKRFMKLQGGSVGWRIGARWRPALRDQEGDEYEQRGKPVKCLGEAAVADSCTR